MGNYLVTGGCGFIGSHLVESLLKSHHNVRVLDNLSTGKRANISPKCELLVGDITDKHAVEKAMNGVDGCYHLAAIASVEMSNQQWTNTHQVNLTGAINILDAARQSCVPVVYASSAAVYGDNAETPLNERSAVRPMTAYGADKLGCELHARVASLVHGVPTTGLRFFNVYGPRQDPSSPYSGVISIFVDRVLAGEGVTIFGDGEQLRDFVYVSDVVRFLREGMKRNTVHPHVLNVCTGSSVSINQLATSIMAISGSAVAVSHQASRKGDIRVSVGDPLSSKKLLKISAGFSLLQGLREFIDYRRTELGLELFQYASTN